MDFIGEGLKWFDRFPGRKRGAIRSSYRLAPRSDYRSTTTTVSGCNLNKKLVDFTTARGLDADHLLFKYVPPAEAKRRKRPDRLPDPITLGWTEHDFSAVARPVRR